MRRIPLAFALALLLAASCRERGAVPADTPAADPSAVSTAAGPAPGATEGVNVVDVSAVEYRFELTDQLPAGTTRFIVRNDGKYKHNFEIEGWYSSCSGAAV